ncbi:MAG: RluA family pseudouridine synthase [Saprospiraceae bacterium]|nr:RluA family pseudouridine synthase [Saprospiraceae bacterium]
MTSIKISDLDKQQQDDLYVHEQFVADKGQRPLRIDKFLMDRLDQISRNRVQNAIKASCILVNDKEVKANYKIKPDDVISLVLPRNPDENETLEPENIPLNIIYEDDDILVIDKQAGLVVHPGVGNHSGTLVNALLYHFKDKELPVLQGNAPTRPGLVHRIDKNTSGLMVIAKNDYAMTHLARQFFYHTIEREYIALVWGEPQHQEGTIVGHIGRHPTHPKRFYVYPEGDQGKHAITHYEVVERLYYVSLVKCRLETGRTHQIRVHMKYKGHTLFNDDRYGGDKILKGTIFSKYKQFVENCFQLLPRQGLHARVLGFVHPTTEKPMRFETTLPADMEAALDKWRNYVKSRKETVAEVI